MSRRDGRRRGARGSRPRRNTACPGSWAAPEAAWADGSACRTSADIDWLSLFQSVVDQTTDVVLITDARGHIVHVNPAFELMTGWDRQEVLGAAPSLLRSGLHERSFFADMWNKILRGESFRATIANRRKNGELFYIEQTIGPVRDAEGRITHFVSVGKDASQSRIIQQNQSRMLLARAVQQRFYPKAAPAVNGLDIAGATYPADSLGGDYFDYVTMPGGRLGLVIGDVSGHGLDAALLMSETRAYLRSFASVDADVAGVLTSVNRVLNGDIDESRFVTLMLVRLNPTTRTAVYASAGHETCYLFPREGLRAIELASTGIPLGMFPAARYDSGAKIALATGDVLVLLTDGLRESEDLEGECFGHGRLERAVLGLRERTAREIVEGLIAAQREFSHGTTPADDVTVVVCRAV